MKSALIIGGSRGIGLAIAERLAGDGFEVTVTCRKPTPQIDALPFRKLFFDVTDREGTRAALAEAYGNGGAPEVLIYNSGIARDGLFALMPAREWDDVIETNLTGFYNAVQPFVAPMLHRKSGRIIVISSASGQAGPAGQVNYSASKAALIGAAKALAREVGRKGILVNVVAPGVIETDMTKELPAERVLPLIPLNRFGAPEEVAAAVSFLAGPDSTYVTGQVLAVNGGLVV
ncbi:MAG: 3-oxoacyl-ACP reductase FabG [Victivallales bacterium]|nr:3-oxoacyl-ACP reductase FabG [Victivallales bacterium]